MHMHQLINAAIAADVSMQIRRIPGPGFNLGPLTQKADTQLLRTVRVNDPSVVFKANSM